MNANKIILNNEILIDLTQDTAIEEDVAEGKTFHKADGSIGVGNAKVGSGECDKPHIIEVEELPTEDVDTTGLYKCKGVYYKAGEYGFHDIIVSSDDGVLNGSIKEIYSSLAGI